AHGDFTYGNCCNTEECSWEATCASGSCACNHKDFCGDQQACGEGCGTIQPVEGGDCFCHQGTPCSVATQCKATSECPKGWICAESCCDGPRCLPPCGTYAGQGIAAGSGKMSIGKVI
ncbi:MAG: hypothetical protein ACKOWF_10405, partial [Chloroflexota bacterium]